MGSWRAGDAEEEQPASRRSSSLAADAFDPPEGLPVRRGAGNKRPPLFPLLPLVKMSSCNLELAQKLHALPAAPGTVSVNGAASIVGVQVRQHGALGLLLAVALCL